MQQANERQPSASDAPIDGADFFDACFGMMTAMHSAMLAGLATGTDATAAAMRSGDGPRSWYRRPVETPFGSYMQGSGMFIPGGVFAAFADAVWRPQAEMVLQGMARMPGLGASLPPQFAMGWAPWAMPTSVVPSVFPMMAPITAPTWPRMTAPSAALETHGAAGAAVADVWSATTRTLLDLMSAMIGTSDSHESAPEAPAPDRAETADPDAADFVSYRTSGGHAAANVVRIRDDGLAGVMLPMALAVAIMHVAANLAAAGPAMA